jgi:FAD/FMN-containing dehydrogenase
VPDWAALAAAIDGRVVLPGSPDYGTARRSQMARFDGVHPQAVVLCGSPADVAATIAHARRHCLPLAVRGGGHSVAGRSSTEGVVLDMTGVGGVAVEDGMATVGAGVRLGDLYDALAAHGLTLPAGGSHSVGIAGLTLGGGIGDLGRLHGLTCDRLVAAEVVLADGRLVGCDEHRHPDLFWALRGAGGGNFGVVTSLTFRTVPHPAVTVFHLVWPLAEAIELVRAWQGWAPVGPDELDASLRLSASGEGGRPPLADVFGVVVGGEADAAGLLDDLVARAGADPVSACLRQASYRDAKRYLDGLAPDGAFPDVPPPPPPPAADPVFSRSEFFRRPLPRDAIAAVVEQLPRGLEAGQAREVAFLPWGGAYNRVGADATAFVHRAELFIVQHLAAGSAPGWPARSWGLVHPWGSGGVYPNFPDPDLEDWGRAYYGTNYDRLRTIKARYDPEGFFRFDQSLPAG